MRFRFGPYELDAGRFELRRDGAPLAAEPQVLSLLLFLIANRERMVTRAEIIAAVWDGRFVSDSAVSSRIKSARQLIGDDGTSQRLIRTIHGRGFRFHGDVEEVTFVATAATSPPVPEQAPRPSLAVLPLSVIGDAGPHTVIAEALPHEIIRHLSRLRRLFVIARGSSFRFRDSAPDVARIGETLHVRYVLSGALAVAADRLAISVELADTRDGGVVWAERFERRAGAVHDIGADIVASVVSALELRIPLHEATLARFTAPECLGAWSAYHLGLQRMFCFTAPDNHAAAALFATAVRLEPGFARAHAGLSFTSFQNAFLSYSDAGAATTSARDRAEQAVSLDPLDPFANFAMGRSLWLSGELEGSLSWLDRATQLSPNYAQGTYARAWAQTLLCRGMAGERDADRAMALSPIDPLRYAMLATRALSHLVRGEDGDAAHWAARAAREPGAHELIAVIAAACHSAAGDLPQARKWIEAARRRQPALTQAAFFRSFPFEDSSVRNRISQALGRSGL